MAKGIKMDFVKGTLVEWIHRPGRIGVIVQAGNRAVNPQIIFLDNYEFADIHVSQLIAAQCGTQAATDSRQLKQAIALVRKNCPYSIISQELLTGFTRVLTMIEQRACV
jgi:hypothetical protein